MPRTRAHLFGKLGIKGIVVRKTADRRSVAVMISKAGWLRLRDAVPREQFERAMYFP